MANSKIKQRESGFELLWTNSNPTSAFPETTLNINSTGYQALLIEYSGSGYLSKNDDSGRVTKLIVKNGKATQLELFTSSTLYGSRYISTITDNSIKFNNGNYIWVGSNPSTRTEPYACVPQRIFGVKINIV